MKNRVLIILWAILFGIVTSQQSLYAESALNSSNANVNNRQVFVPGEIVVKLRPNATAYHINGLNTAHGAKVIEEIPSQGFYRLKTNAPAGDAKIFYQANKAVEYAQPNFIFAWINKDHITLFDLEARIHQMVPLFQQRFTQMEPKKKLLRSILADKLFSQAAINEELHKLPEVQRKIRNATEMILAKAFEERIQTVNVSEDELKAYYESNIENYQTSEQIDGRVIIIKKKREIVAMYPS